MAKILYGKKNHMNQMCSHHRLDKELEADLYTILIKYNIKLDLKRFDQ